MRPDRETFSSRFGLLMTMIGVAVGLGNVWRFPYMVGRYGGAPFVLVYVLAVVFLGIPVLIAEWTLGRHTRRGPLGAFERAGLPGGRQVGVFFFLVVTVATGYYTNALGWVLAHAVAQLAGLAGLDLDAGAVLPPDEGVSARAMLLQAGATALLIGGCALVLLRGLRSGIERVSRVIMPTVLVVLAVLLVRALTLPGAWDGVRWYVFKFDPGALDGTIVVAALGHAFFSLSLGGTFMVVYGSYLGDREDLGRAAAWTAAGDLMAGLLAGLAIVPAVIALGLEPGHGPGLLFRTLPRVFEQLPLGGLFGALFYLGLLGAAWLSAIAAFEVLVAGLTDRTGMTRRRAVATMAAVVFVLALPPMINMRVFVPWDLTFGSGMQVLGALVAVLTVGWVLKPPWRWLGWWLRWVVPAAILAVGIWWLLGDVLGWV
jgi:NSS family neurotransmitter:Na+ symporter